MTTTLDNATESLYFHIKEIVNAEIIFICVMYF